MIAMSMTDEQRIAGAHEPRGQGEPRPPRRVRPRQVEGEGDRPGANHKGVIVQLPNGRYIMRVRMKQIGTRPQPGFLTTGDVRRETADNAKTRRLRNTAFVHIRGWRFNPGRHR